jgi:hypothetical protein
MVFENWIASLISMLLSLAGVSSNVQDSVIYVPSLDHRFVVTLSCVDLVGISLWASMFVFVVWVYVSLNGITVSRRRYALYGALGFVIFFCANILRMFVEILYVSSAGASFAGYLVQWQAFEEQVGMGIMFATLTALLVSFHFMSRKKLPVVTPHVRV